VDESEPIMKKVKGSLPLSISLLMAICLSTFCVSTFCWIGGARGDVRVDFGAGKASQTLRSTTIDGAIYVALEDLARVLGSGQFWRAETKKMVLILGEHKVKVTANNPVVVVDDERFQMPHAVRYGTGGLLVPVKYFIPLLGPLLSDGLQWSEADQTLQMNLAETNIRRIQVDPKSNGTLVTITLNQPLNFELSTSRPNWLHLSLFGGTLDPSEFNSVQPIGHVQEIRAYQFPDCAQISFKLKEESISYKAYQQSEPNRILLSLRTESSASGSASEGLIRARGFEPDQAQNPVDVVVIDPGHGGKDPGAIGPSGLKEKEVVLDICKRLASLLRSRLGLKVILTREDDTFISLSGRTKMANAQGADVFVSVHANASKRRAANGFETYFLAEAKNDAGRAAAILENSALRFERPEGSMEGMSDLDFILYDMVQNEFHQESEYLAGIIQEQLDGKLSTTNRRVNQAPFYVLNGAYMPAVLVETAFISNSEEEGLLKKRWFRQKIAEALYESMRSFKEKYERL
jgi:N-acetylmuramoyl-L-alanine amidase